LLKTGFFSYFCKLEKDLFFPLSAAVFSKDIRIGKLLVVYLSPYACAYVSAPACACAYACACASNKDNLLCAFTVSAILVKAIVFIVAIA
jgi:hypothetical protein